MSLSDLLCEAGTNHPAQLALVTPKALVTYGELHRRASSLAIFLIESGLRPGDRVIIYLPKSAELSIAIYGTLLAGGCYVPIDYMTPPARVRLIALDAEPRAIICPLRMGQNLFDNLPISSGVNAERGASKQTFIFMPSHSYPDQSGTDCTPWEQAMNSMASSSPVTSDPTAKAYILYTSGSTGQPKGVVHTHESALTFINWAAEHLQLGVKDVLSQHASPSFDLTIFDFFSSAKAAATLVSVPEWMFGRLDKTCQFIVEKGITVWYSVPSALLRSEGGTRFSALSKSALRHVIFAGEVISVNLLRELMSYLPSGCQVSNWYGPTETNVITYYDISLSDLELDKSIPIGQPCPYARLRIVSETDAATEAPNKGELLVASPTVMKEYWKQDDLTANVSMMEPDGQRYYKTGDLVAEDHGRLIFLGRKDRLLKVRGYRLQPEEIEHVLQGHADVLEAAVVTISEDGMENIAGVIATANLEDGLLTELKKVCEEMLPPYMVPSKIIRVDALPRNARGKIDRQAIQHLISS